jgi:hypothetical protein
VCAGVLSSSSDLCAVEEEKAVGAAARPIFSSSP